MTKPYTPPSLVKIGSLQELTLRSKAFKHSFDGDFFNGRPLTTIS